MLRRDKWWIREIERINRAHAEERTVLIDTIARLAGKPAPDPWTAPVEEPEPPTWTTSPEQQPIP